MRMIRQSARGGDLIRQLRKKLEAEFWDKGGMFTYLAPSGPVDDADYNDPHLPKERRPIVDDDLEGWFPLW